LEVVPFICVEDDRNVAKNVDEAGGGMGLACVAKVPWCCRRRPNQWDTPWPRKRKDKRIKRRLIPCSCDELEKHHTLPLHSVEV